MRNYLMTTTSLPALVQWLAIAMGPPILPRPEWANVGDWYVGVGTLACGQRRMRLMAQRGE